MKSLACFLFLLLSLVVGCSPPAAESTAITLPPPLAPEVQRLATQRGTAIASETFSLLSSNLQSAIQSGGVSNALPFCSLAATPLTAGMAEKQGVTLRRVTHRPRHPAARATATESAILQSFEVALVASNHPPAAFATNLVVGEATFFAPIVISNELCLKCHGEPDENISPADLAIIRQLYPHDQATGFKLGQLRGAWRIDFPLATLTPSAETHTP